MQFKDKLKSILDDSDSEVINDLFNSGINDNIKQGSEEITKFRKQLKEADITFEHEVQYGGEDMGSNYYSIYSFVKDVETIYVKFDGWYASHCGSDFDKWFFVEPKQKTVTVFE